MKILLSLSKDELREKLETQFKSFSAGSVIFFSEEILKLLNNLVPVQLTKMKEANGFILLSHLTGMKLYLSDKGQIQEAISGLPDSRKYNLFTGESLFNLHGWEQREFLPLFCYFLLGELYQRSLAGIQNELSNVLWEELWISVNASRLALKHWECFSPENPSCNEDAQTTMINDLMRDLTALTMEPAVQLLLPVGLTKNHAAYFSLFFTKSLCEIRVFNAGWGSTYHPSDGVEGSKHIYPFYLGDVNFEDETKVESLREYFHFLFKNSHVEFSAPTVRESDRMKSTFLSKVYKKRLAFNVIQNKKSAKIYSFPEQVGEGTCVTYNFFAWLHYCNHRNSILEENSPKSVYAFLWEKIIKFSVTQLAESQQFSSNLDCYLNKRATIEFKKDESIDGNIHSLTPRLEVEGHPLYARPGTLQYVQYFKESFLERPELLKDFHERLTNKGYQIVSGWPGVGKTTFIVSYALTYGRQIYNDRKIYYSRFLEKNKSDFWIFLFKIFGVKFVWHDDPIKRDDGALVVALDELSVKGKFLFIFDNVFDRDSLGPCLELLIQRNHHVIISSFAPREKWKEEAEYFYEVNPFSDQEAELYLDKFLKKQTPIAGVVSEQEKQEILLLIKQNFKNLPIAFKVLLKDPSLKMKDLLNELKQQSEKTIEKLNKGSKGADIHEVSLSVSIETQMSFMNVQEQALICTIALLGSNTFDTTLLREIYLYLFSDEKFEKNFKKLKNSYFIEKTVSDSRENPQLKNKYCMHYLFRKLIRDICKDNVVNIEKFNLTTEDKEKLESGNNTIHLGPFVASKIVKFFLSRIDFDRFREAPPDRCDAYLFYISDVIEHSKKMLSSSEDIKNLSDLSLNASYLNYQNCKFETAKFLVNESKELINQDKAKDLFDLQPMEHVLFDIRICIIKSKILVRLKEYDEAGKIYFELKKKIDDLVANKKIESRYLIAIMEYKSIIYSSFASFLIKKEHCEWVEVQALLDEALAIKKDRFGEKSSEYGLTLQIYGNFLFEIGDYKGALEKYKSAEECFKVFYKNYKSLQSNETPNDFQMHPLYLTISRRKVSAYRLAGYYQESLHESEILLSLYTSSGMSNSHYSVILANLEKAKNLFYKYLFNESEEVILKNIFFCKREEIDFDNVKEWPPSLKVVSNAEALYYLGRIKMINGNFRHAKIIFIEVLNLFKQGHCLSEKRRSASIDIDLLDTLKGLGCNYERKYLTDYSKVMTQLANCHYYEGDYRAAELFYEEDKKITRHLPKSPNRNPHPKILMRDFGLASLHYRKGSYNDAEKIAREILKEQKKIYSIEYLLYSNLSELKDGFIYVKTKEENKKYSIVYSFLSPEMDKIVISGEIKQEDKFKYFDDIINNIITMTIQTIEIKIKKQLIVFLAIKHKLEERMLGYHVDIAEVYRLLGRIMLRQGRFEEAEKKLKKAYHIHQKLRHKSPAEYLTIYNQARLATYKSDFSKAEKLFFEGLQGINEIFSYLERYQDDKRTYVFHPYAARFAVALGHLSYSQGKYAEALKYIDISERLCQRIGHNKHPTNALIQKYRGDVLYMCYRQNVDKIEECFSAALKINGDSHPQSYSIYLSLALLEIYKSENKTNVDYYFSRAEACLKEIMSNSDPRAAKHHRYAEYHFAKGHFYAEYGCYVSAHENFMEAKKIMDAVNKNYFNPRWIKLRIKYVSFLMKLEQREEALSQLLDILKGWVQHFLNEDTTRKSNDQIQELFIEKYTSLTKDNSEQLSTQILLPTLLSLCHALAECTFDPKFLELEKRLLKFLYKDLSMAEKNRINYKTLRARIFFEIIQKEIAQPNKIEKLARLSNIYEKLLANTALQNNTSDFKKNRHLLRINSDVHKWHAIYLNNRAIFEKNASLFDEAAKQAFMSLKMKYAFYASFMDDETILCLLDIFLIQVVLIKIFSEFPSGKATSQLFIQWIEFLNSFSREKVFSKDLQKITDKIEDMKPVYLDVLLNILVFYNNVFEKSNTDNLFISEVVKARFLTILAIAYECIAKAARIKKDHHRAQIELLEEALNFKLKAFGKLSKLPASNSSDQVKKEAEKK